MSEQMMRAASGEMSRPEVGDRFFEVIPEMTDLELLDFLESGSASLDYATDASPASKGEKADTLQLKVIHCSE